jgi:hypothetical protein
MKTIKIYLNSKYLLLDRDNLPGLHDHETALQRAKDAGKRLPTKEEFEALAALPHRWDDKRKGMCFRIPTRKPFTGWLRAQIKRSKKYGTKRLIRNWRKLKRLRPISQSSKFNHQVAIIGFRAGGCLQFAK